MRKKLKIGDRKIFRPLARNSVVDLPHEREGKPVEIIGPGEDGWELKVRPPGHTSKAFFCNGDELF